MDATNNIATDLFYKVRSRFSGLKLGAETGEITINPEQARFFDFDYTEGETPMGHVSISLAEPNSMKVYFSNGITEGMDDTSLRRNVLRSAATCGRRVVQPRVRHPTRNNHTHDRSRAKPHA